MVFAAARAPLAPRPSSSAFTRWHKLSVRPQSLFLEGPDPSLTGRSKSTIEPRNTVSMGSLCSPSLVKTNMPDGRSQPPNASPTPPPIDPSSVHPERAAIPPPLSILAIDDDDDYRQFLRTVLEGEGHSVRAVATPPDLYAACEASLPEVILLDMKMGRFDGNAVLEELRRRWPKVCVIVVTGYPSLDSMRQTFKQDVFDYLAKPFSIDDLRRTLSQAASAFGFGGHPMDRLRVELGRQIRLARTERAWTLRDLSASCGLSVSQLSSIERGSHLPSVESLIGIATALDRRASEWLGAAGL